MYTVHMEIEGVNCSVAELVSRPVGISWSSHFPRLRRASRVFERLSRVADPAVGDRCWSAYSDEGGDGPGATVNASAGLLLPLGSSHRTPPPSVGLGVHSIGGGTRLAACDCQTDTLVTRKDDLWYLCPMRSRFRSYFPLKDGLVFSRKDFVPARKSSVEATKPK